MCEEESWQAPLWRAYHSNHAVKGLDFADVADQSLFSIEIGKETLIQMMLRMSPEGWIKPRNEVIHIGHGDDDRTKEVPKERLKEQAEIDRKMKAKAPVPV